MPIDATLADVTAKLRQGRFPNEQAISQGIVLRVLSDLGWDTYETTIVWPEYQTGEGRADFALCHPPSRPAVFIEVKQPGKAEDGVRQALEYAFHTGVPFIVLTDGKTWSFYLPAEQGTYEDRRVYKLDLFERDSDQAASILVKYLDRVRIASGEALETARKEYRSRTRRSQACGAIPEAWNEVVDKGDELLIDLLATAVESKAGVRPEDDDISTFLGSLTPAPAGPVPAGSGDQTSTDTFARPRKVERSHASPRAGTLDLQGRSYPYANAKEAMVRILRELALRDPTFLQRCAQHPDSRGRKRAYIARSAEELFPDRPDLRELHESLPGGWLVSTNLNNALKKNIIRMAADVAGLTFGKDVIVEF